MGCSLNIETDRKILENLPKAQVKLLVEPHRQELTDSLWAQNWDILFFAGHSSSSDDRTTGRISIDRTDSLSIEELRYGLKQAIANGLKIAIFNSCDGLGLAKSLADLQIPQVIVMREPIPDRVAQTTVCQHGTSHPPTWQQLQGAAGTNQRQLKVALLSSLVTTIAIAATRCLGILQPLELNAFDLAMRSRPGSPRKIV